MKKNPFFKIFKIALIIYVLIGITLFFTQKLFLFHGKKLNANYAFSFNEQPFTEHNITTANGKNLHYLQFMPNDTASAGILIYYHGNMGNINNYAAKIRVFTANNYIVYMPDYPGFGKTTGAITENRMKQDAQLIYDEAAKQVGNNKITIYGKSMGTGLACYIAANNSCKRLLLETPYYSLPTVYDDYAWMYPTKWLLQFHFNNYTSVPAIKCPITIFHGTNDRLITLKNASKLKPLLKPTDEFVTIPDAKHNNVVDFPLYIDKLDSILSVDAMQEQQ
jgi:alpha-beta hydrolase superfamily lysophospholipase